MDGDCGPDEHTHVHGTDSNNKTQDLTRANEREKSLCSLVGCSLKVGDLSSARSLHDALSSLSLSDVELIGGMAALIATERVESNTPLRKGRLAMWRWLLNNPASITQEDEDRATAAIRELRGEPQRGSAADEPESLGDILEGATWLDKGGVTGARSEMTGRTTTTE
jgi:hypothetical protein